MSWKDARAFSRSSATICRSISSIPACYGVQAQRIGIETAARQRESFTWPTDEPRRATMAQQTAPSTAATPAPITTSCRSTASTTSSCTSATRCRPPTTTRTPSASARSPTRGLETGTRDRASHVLQQGRIRLVLTGALHSDSPIAAHQHSHGDGVKVIALCVPDVDHAYREATTRGAEGVVEPHDAHRRARHRPPGDDQDLRRDAAHLRRARRLRRARSCPASTPSRTRTEDTGMLLGHRPHRRQRRARPDGRVGQVLRGRLRDDAR